MPYLRRGVVGMSDFDSLTWALEGWFDTLLRDLPEAVRQRVEQDFFPLPWDSFSAAKRLRAALLFDWQHDPSTEHDQKLWSDYFDHKFDLEKQISQWEAIATPTAGEMAQKETRLAELRQKLVHKEKYPWQARGDDYPVLQHFDDKGWSSSIKQDSLVRYVDFPTAMKLLAGQLHATPEEIAAWVWRGPEDGGLAAYLNANELDSPPRFHYEDCLDDFDYLTPLTICWFLKDDIANFEADDQYITGKALIKRWSKQPGIQPEAFITAKIAESRLLDSHPICGCTQGTFPQDKTLPPLTSGLFLLWQVLEIEAKNFGKKVEAIETENFGESLSERHTKPLGHLNHDQEMQARANKIAAEQNAATGRPITRNKAAQILAKELGTDEGTVLRRIRKQWK